MKVLKDPDQVLQILDQKLEELHKKFDEAKGLKAAEIFGQETAIIRILSRIRNAIDDHEKFDESDMAGVYAYAADAKKNAYEHLNPRDT